MKSDQLRRLAARIEAGTLLDVRQDDGTIVRARARSRPWTLPCGIDVVKYEGRTGGYRLDRCSIVASEVTDDE